MSRVICRALLVNSHVCNNLFAFWVSVNVYLSNLSFVHTVLFMSILFLYVVSRCYNTTFLEVTVNGAQSERNKED